MMYRNNYRPGPQRMMAGGNCGETHNVDAGCNRDNMVKKDCCKEVKKEFAATRDCDCEMAEEMDCMPKPDFACEPSIKDPIGDMPIAMSYVPWQDYEGIYPCEQGWKQGTIFCKLDLDFYARRCE